MTGRAAQIFPHVIATAIKRSVVSWDDTATTRIETKLAVGDSTNIMADHDAQKQVEALRMEMDAMHDIMAGGCCPINSRGDKDRAAWLGSGLGWS